MNSPEFRERFSGRYFGKYRGFASVIDDPMQRNRVKVKVPAILGQQDLGWAWPAPAQGGGDNTGDTTLPSVNDLVWVEFEAGDPSRPIWSAGPWGSRNGKNMLPEHARGLGDDADYARRDYGNIPPSQFSGTYGNVRIIKNKGKSFLEFDDTPGAERIQIFHRTGSRIEFQSDGGLQEIVGAHSVRHVGANQKTQILGSERHSVGAERLFDVAGKSDETYGAARTTTMRDHTVIGHAYKATWSSTYEIQVNGSFKHNVLAQAKTNIGGQWSVSCGQNYSLFAAENVEISAGNASGLISIPPKTVALLMQGYNGQAVFMGSDVTGKLVTPRLVCDGITGILDLYAGTIGSGAIQLLPAPAGNVLLGGLGALEFLIKGTTHIAALTAFLQATGIAAKTATTPATVLTAVQAMGAAADALALLLPSHLSLISATK